MWLRVQDGLLHGVPELPVEPRLFSIESAFTW